MSTAAMPQGRSRMLYFDRRASTATTTRSDSSTANTPSYAALSTPLPRLACAGYTARRQAPHFNRWSFASSCAAASLAQPRENGAARATLKPRCKNAPLFPACARGASKSSCGAGMSARPPPRAGRRLLCRGRVRIAMTDLLLNSDYRLPKPPPGEWMCEAVRQMAACACSLARPECSGPSGATAAAELKADADGVMAALDHEVTRAGTSTRSSARSTRRASGYCGAAVASAAAGPRRSKWTPSESYPGIHPTLAKRMGTCFVCSGSLF